MMIKKNLIFCAVWGILALPLMAYDYQFKHLDTKDGLSNRQVNTILKDSQGFMWFGTGSGLNRFDGYNFRTFYMSPTDMKTLPDNYIENIQEASGGELWIRTGSGYVIYDSQKESFDRDVRQRIWNYGLEQHPTLIFIDRNKDFWFYVEETGCYWYKSDQKLLYSFLFHNNELPDGNIVSMTDCNEGVLLVYADGRLACLNGKQRHMVWQSDFIPESGQKLAGQCSAFADRKDNIWVYGPSLLWIYNRTQGKWATSISSLAEQWGLPPIPDIQGSVKSVTQDKEGRIWLGTEREGLLVIDPMNRSIARLTTDEDNERSLSNDHICTLYTDNTGMVWIGTQHRGVSYHHKSIYKFNLDYVGEVTSVSEDTERDCLWLGTNGSGLLKRDNASGTLTAYTREGGSALSGNVVNTTLVSQDGGVYVATYRGGLDHFDGSRFTHLHFADSIKGTITSLAEDPDGNLWVGFMGGGLRIYNPKTGSIMPLTVERSKLVSDYVTCLALGRERNMLVGTVDGLSLVSLTNRRVQNLTGCKAGNKPFSNTYINQAYQDGRGYIWLATRNGLNIYHPGKDLLQILDEESGLSDVVICSLVEDNDQAIWAATSRGVSHIIPKDNTRGISDFQIYNYDELDGLQGYELTPRAVCRTASGEIVMGGLRGINRFVPSEIVFDKVLPRVIFTGLLIDDKPVVIDRLYNGKVILDRAIGQTQRIRLDASQNRFEVQVATDSHNLPEKMKYLYMLDGYDKEWLVGRKNTYSIAYSNLPGGRYTLRVKAVNSDGYAGDEETTLKVVVTPPMWRTWWAYLLYAAVALLLLDIARRLVIRKERARWTKEMEGKLPPAPAPKAAEPEEPLHKEEDNTEPMLPVWTEQAMKEPERVEPVKPVQPEEMPKLMLVDDKEEFREYMAEQLKYLFRVQTVEGALKAWELLEDAPKEELPDVILCDMELPEMDGNELCNLVKANNATEKIPFIMMTDKLNTGERPQNLLFGADDYLSKPFSIKLLAERIQKLLNWQKSEGKGGIFEYKNADMTLADAAMSEEDNEWFGRAIRYVEDNLSRMDLSVADMGTALGIERSRIYRIIQTVSGKTPVEFIREIRLKRAARMLLDTDLEVSDVSQAAGFKNIKIFRKCFEDEFGMDPASYKIGKLIR